MGPRPVDRGNYYEGVLGGAFTKLQWGRDQSIAEIFRCGNYGVWDQLLQWGRDHLIAEMPSG